MKGSSLIEILKHENLGVGNIFVNSSASGILAAWLSFPDHTDNFPYVFGIGYVSFAVVTPTLMHVGSKAYDVLRAYARKG